ncbi:MAG: prepilin-type N-terminal cleavage/methylation domain-containing protein [Verrucomicrobia bacterium]|nr:prepilin-type N-terminal cleavage/methylation domain-containing protein [Verrucomicrobiota bacterium]
MASINSAPRSKNNASGFTLVEVVVATMLFTFMALSVSRLTMASMRISHLNVYKTTAMSVAQGYMEQIKSLDNETLIRLSTQEVELPLTSNQVLPTRSVSLLSAGATLDQIDDWLVANTLDPSTLSDTLDVINHKEIIIDVDQNTGQVKTMDMWIDVEIHRMSNVPGDTFLIDLQYIHSLPGLSDATTLTREVYIRRNTRDYIRATRTMRHRPNANDGRLQLVTTLLNLESI